MKKYIVICITFFIPYNCTIQGMNNPSLDNLVQTINTEINTYSSENILLPPCFSSFFLSEKNRFDIIKIIAQHINNGTSYDLITILRQKNKFVESTIDYFIALVHQNLKNVTCTTLQHIENQLSLHPEKELKKLPPLFKAYITKCAYNQITCQYTMLLMGHRDAISCFDISPIRHLAATSSTNTLCLWDLEKGIATYKFRCLPIKLIKFTSNGSYITAIEHVCNGSYSTYVWNTSSGTCVWEEKFTDLPFDHHFYIKNDVTHTLVKDNYYAVHSPNNSKQLSITKKNCQPLYLCHQAIKNSAPNSALNLIKQSQSYQSLTEYEKQIINNKIQDAS